MKDTYMNYLGRMREIEDNISKEDNVVIDDYIKFCSLGAGADKVEQRKRYALQFLDIAEVSFKDFDRKIIEGIYLAIKNSYRETAGKNEAIKNLKYFIRWLKDDENLLKGLKPITQRKGYNTDKLNPSTLPTEKDLKLMIGAAKDNSMHLAMISLQTELALRPCELIPLSWKSIKIVDGVGEVKVYSSKTKETRTLPFKDSVEAILKWKSVYPFPDRKPSDLIFPNRVRGQKLYRSYLSQLYRRLSIKAGLKNQYPYLWRHAKLTKMNGKLPGKVAAEYGGHSEKTASIYTHLSEADIRDIVLKEIYDVKEPNIKESKKLREEVEKLKTELQHQKQLIVTNNKEINDFVKKFRVKKSDLLKKQKN